MLKGMNFVKILIVRHGDPDYEADSLTEKGWREAKLLSERLSKIKIDAMYVSPLGRARATALPLEEKTGRKAEVLPWLHEFKGKIISTHSGKERIAWDMAPGIWCNEPRYYDIEKWSEVPVMMTGNAKSEYELIGKGIDALLAQHGIVRDGRIFRIKEGTEEKTIVLFCHFCLGIIIVSHLAGISPVIMWNNFFLAPTSVSELVTETDADGNSHFRCAALGDTSHLFAGKEPVSESGLYPRFEY